MQLTVLGSRAPYPIPGRACPGYLVEEEGWRVLVDAGSGSLANLRRIMPPEELDAVILTHLHADHFSDFLSLRYIIYRWRRDRLREAPLPVYAPARPGEVVPLIGYKDDVVHQPLTAGRLELGPWQLSFRLTNHPVECYAVRFDGPSGSLAYSADTGPSDDLLNLACESDLFLCEASLLEEDRKHGNQAGHLTARQAGALARQARVGKLVLTHLWPEYDEERVRKEASDEFEGPLQVARDLEVYPV
ncbi:MAG: MBL fold metallo-hydrolase [Bacillota bacterium]